MKVLYLPIIQQNDFETFLKIMNNDIAPTYEEWLQRHSDRITHYRETRRIIEVQINPKEFASFVNSRISGTKGKLLLDFAEVVGKQNA
jgi:hypothetical protein